MRLHSSALGRGRYDHLDPTKLRRSEETLCRICSVQIQPRLLPLRCAGAVAYRSNQGYYHRKVQTGNSRLPPAACHFLLEKNVVFPFIVPSILSRSYHIRNSDPGSPSRLPSPLHTTAMKCKPSARIHICILWYT